MFSNFTEEARNIIVNAKIERKNLKHPYVGSEHLLLAILKEDNSVSKKLKEFNVTYENFKKELINIVGMGKEDTDLFLYTPLLKRILETATLDSKESNEDVTIEHLFSAFLEEGEGVAIRILIGMNIDLEDLYSEFMYKVIPNKKISGKLLIEELGVDLTKRAKKGDLDPVIGREKEINRLLEILSRRTKNNPILIGEAGVGKTAIVEELSRRIVSDKVPLNLRNKKIINVDMASLVAGTKYRGEFEERVKKLLSEVEENDDIILFIDEIHTLVGAGGAEGAIDASNIFKPALARNKFRVIGATTTSEYKKFIEKDSALERRFQKINVEIPTTEETKEILKQIKNIYEKYHYVSLDDSILSLIVELSEKYIHDRNEPDKSLDILDEVCARVNIKEDNNIKKYNLLKKQYDNILLEKEKSIEENNFIEASRLKDKENEIMTSINELEIHLIKRHPKKVKKEDVAFVLSEKTKIPIYELLNDNKKVINKMEKQMEKVIIGQDEAIDEVIKVAKKIKLGYKENKCYSMLFVGPSGVGKTMLAKTFGNLLTNNVIKLDMSEYSEPHSVSKIIGAPPGYVGYESFSNILEEVRNNPYSVVILDEIERAHPNVINLFLNILEEGKIKDSTGRTICFNHTTIIMTSNVGFDDISVGFCKEKKSEIQTKLQDFFQIPFLNRIDNIIVFNRFTEKSIEKLINKKIEQIIKQYPDYKIQITNEALKEMKIESHYNEYGARKIDRILKDKLVNIIIDNILQDKKEIVIETLKKESIS